MQAHTPLAVQSDALPSNTRSLEARVGSIALEKALKEEMANEVMDQLRKVVKEMDKDAWMYEPSNNSPVHATLNLVTLLHARNQSISAHSASEFREFHSLNAHVLETAPFPEFLKPPSFLSRVKSFFHTPPTTHQLVQEINLVAGAFLSSISQQLSISSSITSRTLLYSPSLSMRPSSEETSLVQFMQSRKRKPSSAAPIDYESAHSYSPIASFRQDSTSSRNLQKELNVDSRVSLKRRRLEADGFGDNNIQDSVISTKIRVLKVVGLWDSRCDYCNENFWVERQSTASAASYEESDILSSYE
ncbi:hypothetical protein BCR33DRAFT_853072 [Rhizoclosmatium globosum]|uniref:Uncharacterized protein n=1 Tax=Rhizoclosmatium globosum TaxID=329046 RepID=A0A1Y2BYW7_9FUNG|nr:hypothetical protein BCR33DRAFT_853072 [Rhizoclosmatium globosum]|eukprot:ORY39950.1 hypothetical protein BCR33DRAFT_853072 [Rhizoclosmatium globosum]